MTFAPGPVYSEGDSGRPPLALLREIGDQEFPDVTITEAEKCSIRAEVRAAAVSQSVQACMYAAGAWEQEAARKSGEERRGAAAV